jgi:hypothetical protein
MGGLEYPCTDETLTQSEQLGVAMAGRLLAGIGAVDHGEPTPEDISGAARVADKVAGEERYEPFASAAVYLRTAGIGATACARRWASRSCPTNCILFEQLRKSDD